MTVEVVDGTQPAPVIYVEVIQGVSISISGGIVPISPLPARPTTLNQVINLLVAYGMCS